MATIKDIAREVGVSAMTVSRSFNNPDTVKEEVRMTILEVAKEMNYMPNQAARSLAASKSGVVQIVTGLDPSIYYFTQLFTGAAQYLSKHGLSTMISYKEKGNFQYDGVIYMGLEEGADRRLFRSEKKPVVLFGKSELPIDWVDINSVDGIYTVAKHLIDNGHTQIGYIGIDSNEIFNKERYQGYGNAMDDHALTIDNHCIFFTEHSEAGVESIGEAILANKNVTAYVCETDFLAYRLIEYCKEHNVSVPDDLSVVGFDGILHNKLSSPHITTVVQPVYQIGIELAKALITRMAEPDAPREEKLLKTTFEVGGTVKDLNARV